MMVYTRAIPQNTFVDLEDGFRANGFKTHLIAKEQEISETHTIVNLQGKTGCKYVVSFQLSDKPRRPKFAAGWPSSKEENLQRLQDAGYIMDGMKPKCGNCGSM